ncbi:MAG: thioredoxin family protein [Planctomycetota bacterium]|nr:thioredoxin family protein [Planctomycetota bacterium]
MSDPISIPILTPKQFRSLLANQTHALVAEFWAAWCAPCRRTAQELQILAQEFGEHLTLVRIDIDAAPELTEQYGVASVPTLLAFMNGQETNRVSGALRPDELRAFLVGVCDRTETP